MALRAWAGWLELWRSDDDLESLLRDHRDDELAILAECVGHRLERDGLRALHALIDGLHAALVEPVQPLRPRTASSILTAHLAVHGISDPRWLPVA